MEDKNNSQINKENQEDIIMDEKDSHHKKMELLDKMMDDITFSDDEEDQNNKQKFILNESNYKDERSKISKLYEQTGEEGVDEGTMNTYTGTKHEIINELERKDFPVPYKVNIEDKFEECGIIKNIVENKILMVGINNNILKVLNLDNIIFLPDKQYIGFIDDVIGQIENPIYVIKIYPNLIEKKLLENIKIEDKLYYCSNRAMVLNAVELKNKNKGCDASNVFDEEVSEGEKDYSDDEEEVNAKIRRKNKKKNKKMKIEDDLINNKNNQINTDQKTDNNNVINAPYSFNNCSKSKEELNKQMDIFINNALNMNINPFSNPFNNPFSLDINDNKQNDNSNLNNINEKIK